MAALAKNVYEQAFRELNACQLAVLRAMQTNHLVGLMMPRQVGKTHFGIWAIRQTMLQNKNAQTMFLAKDFPSIKRNTQEKFLKLFDENDFNVTTQGVEHVNKGPKARGACFLSGVDKNPHKIRGGTMAFVHWSEVAFSRFEQGQSFKTIHETVVLPTISRTHGYYLLESTPLGTNFWKDWWDAENGFLKIVFALELCIQLGAITRAQADFMQRTMHPDVFKQEMLCMFVSFLGKIYKEYDPSRHNAAANPEPHERIIIGIDVGYTAGFSALFAVWREGKLYIFDQVYQQGLRVDQMADEVQKKIDFYKIPKHQYTAYTDHDPDMVEELNKRKIPVKNADKLDRFACRMDLKSALYFDQLLVNPVKCPQLDKEMQAATWSEKHADEMEERGDPNAGHWDSEASLRYLWRGSKLELEKPEEVPDHVQQDPNAMAEWEARALRRRAQQSNIVIPGKTFEY